MLEGVDEGGRGCGEDAVEFGQQVVSPKEANGSRTSASVVHEPARDKPGGKLESARLVRGVGSDCGEISGPGSNGSSRLEPVRAK